MKRIGSGSNQVHQPFSLKDKLKRTVALGLTGLALSGPMTGEVRGEQNPMNPPTTTTEKGEMPSQETELVSEEEKRQLRAMIMDFEGVKSEDLPYETIRKLMAENEDRKYGDYRQQLREAGCEDEDRIEICAKWMYAVDNYRGGVIKNSKADDKYGYIKTYVNNEQIINYALTGEGLNVYCDKEGKPKFLLVHTDKRNEKAFRAAIEWYEKHGAENVVEVLSNNGFCVWFPYVFNEDVGFGSAILEFNTGVINQNMDKDFVNKFKDKVLVNGIISVLGVESMGIGHGQMMDSLLDHNAGLYYELSLSGAHLEIVKALMMGYNYDFLFRQTKENKYQILSDDKNGMAYDWAQRLNSSVNDPYVIRQLEMMTLGGLSKPLGGDNWEFAREAIEGLKK